MFLKTNHNQAISQKNSQLASAEAIVKHQHPPKQHPPQEYSNLVSSVITTGKKSKEGQGSKPDACSLEDKENTYQALIPQQQPPHRNEYQSLTKHSLHYNIPTGLLAKPETKLYTK